ncbi:sn-glycerol-3-phosphate ABC transporter ATP-binding protein UgpC [Pseudoduganella eburnea]|uniref:sn-glycerol-3-phosphate ABC transporter ATP-binding protein UgpC n=1 Tax=Massilia eburnea TaxID=1776165 RepID=A0A6L6QCI1_9BURK|nr:ABC transporter ATP-binding protein [Massilia eburnea]MTW09443.1 sn-glycerol-3-phosphate ABC transporter ATP-binding protein UgpC [Massilia eburnea]
MSNVSLKKLDVTLGGNAIIRRLDLDVKEGEFLVLLGPSGCGKSTLLHSIAGLIESSGGAIEIGGKDMSHVDPSERGIGMVFQSYALYPSMTVEKNMSFGLRIAGVAKAEIKRRVEKAAAMLHLGELLQRKPAALSGGQRQRVAIGRALVREAGVYLFDEPLSNLDAKLRTDLRRELKLLHQKLGATMIYVTHDQVEAMTLASRIVVMRAGAIQQVGTPAEVYERPANLFVAGFLGAPAMNFIEGSIDAQGVFAGGAVRLALGTAGGAAKAVLGVRPEHIAIAPGGPLQGRVTLVEPMGAHRVVWLDCGGRQLSCIVQGSRALAPDDAVSFAIDAQRVSLFDPDSGQRFETAGASSMLAMTL